MLCFYSVQTWKIIYLSYQFLLFSTHGFHFPFFYLHLELKRKKCLYFVTGFIWCEDTLKISDCPWECGPDKLTHSSILV